MARIKIFIVFLFVALSFCLSSCASKDRAKKLYSELQPFAIKNEIIMNDNNHIFLNGKDFYLKGNANYEICYNTADRIYFVEERDGKYTLKSVDYNGENEKSIQEVNDYLSLSPSGELYQIINDDYYFYNIDDGLKLNQIINKSQTSELDTKLYGDKKFTVKRNEDSNGFVFSSREKTVELTIKDIRNVENVGDILKNYDLKAYDYYCFGEALYFNVTIKFGVWDRIFLCFKYENDKLTFVDACLYNFDSIEITKYV